MAVNHKIHKFNEEWMEVKSLTPMKAIRYKCQQCSNWQYIEIKKCPCIDCALYLYRMGKRPRS